MILTALALFRAASVTNPTRRKGAEKAEPKYLFTIRSMDLGLATCGYARDIYVTADGNNNHSGTKENPVATLEAAQFNQTVQDNS